MAGRSRTRVIAGPTGTMTYVGYTDGTFVSDTIAKSEQCIDVVDQGPGQLFDVHRYTISDYYRTGPVGLRPPGDTRPPRGYCNQYAPTGVRNATWTGAHQSIPGMPSLSERATELLQKTNPSRPVVDLPIAVAELRDLPRLLHSAGRSVLRQAANANLSYWFAIKPMVDDFLKLLQFTDEINKRSKELDKLGESGLRRKRNLWSGSVTGSWTTQVVNSNPPAVWVEIRSRPTTEAISWGFVRWSPTVKTPRTKADVVRYARRAVLGLTVDFSTVWELLPWSWLIDWFADVGGYFEAHRNIVPCTSSVPLIMTKTTTTRKSENIVGAGAFEGYAPTGIRVQLSRRQAGSFLNAQLPFLSARRMSIIGSLAVLKRR